MQVRSHLLGDGTLSISRNAAVRTGVCVGLCLSIIFGAWVLLANRVPFLEPFALQRNLVAAAALGLIALIPVARFWAKPGALWAAGSISWALLSISYRLMGMVFPGLEERYGAFHVFMTGAVVYTILATLSWIGTVVWRLCHAHAGAHPGSHSSATHSNHHTT